MLSHYTYSVTICKVCLRMKLVSPHCLPGIVGELCLSPICASLVRATGRALVAAADRYGEIVRWRSRKNAVASLLPRGAREQIALNLVASVVPRPRWPFDAASAEYHCQPLHREVFRVRSRQPAPRRRGLIRELVEPVHGLRLCGERLLDPGDVLGLLARKSGGELADLGIRGGAAHALEVRFRTPFSGERHQQRMVRQHAPIQEFVGRDLR